MENQEEDIIRVVQEEDVRVAHVVVAVLEQWDALKDQTIQVIFSPQTLNRDFKMIKTV